MSRFQNSRTAFAVIGLSSLGFGVLAAGYFFGGFYSVAARAEDPQLVNTALIQVRTASIERHADTVQPPPSLDDPSLIRAGARWLTPSGAALVATARRASGRLGFLKG